MADLLSALEPPAAWSGEFSASTEPRGRITPRVVEAQADPDDFDWFTDASVLVREQLSFAVYRNRVDAIVIRQDGAGYDAGDQFVILRDADAVHTLIGALLRELKAVKR